MKTSCKKLSPLGKMISKALVDRDMTKGQLAQAVGMAQPYLSYILYGERSGEKYLPAIVAVLKLDPQKVDKATAA